MEQQEFRHSFFRQQNSRSQLTDVKVSILAYRGNVLDPQWMDKEPGKPGGKVAMHITDEWFQMQAHFTTMCHVIADTSTIASSLRAQRAPGVGDYYTLHFDVILLFGLTELKAQISWNDMVRLSFCRVGNTISLTCRPRVWRRGTTQAMDSNDAFFLLI